MDRAKWYSTWLWMGTGRNAFGCSNFLLPIFFVSWVHSAGGNAQWDNFITKNYQNLWVVFDRYWVFTPGITFSNTSYSYEKI